MNSWFEDLLGDINVNENRAKELYPFDVRVGVVRMAAPRHNRFEYYRELGSGLIGKIFSGSPL